MGATLNRLSFFRDCSKQLYAFSYEERTQLWGNLNCYSTEAVWETISFLNFINSSSSVMVSILIEDVHPDAASAASHSSSRWSWVRSLEYQNCNRNAYVQGFFLSFPTASPEYPFINNEVWGFSLIDWAPLTRVSQLKIENFTINLHASNTCNK